MLNSLSRRPLFAAVLVFALAAIAAATLVWHLAQRERQEERARVSSLAAESAGNLKLAIEHNLSAAYALAALVRQAGGAFPDFDEVAGQMLPFYPGVSELALAPGGIVRHVAPLAGNEKAKGLDLLRDPVQKREALLARNSGKLTLAGPLDLAQGGLGVVGRLPVILDDAEGKPAFWGFTLVMMRFPEVLTAVNLHHLTEQGFAYELSRTHPDNGQKQTIGASIGAALIEPVVQNLDVSNATWTLSVAPLRGWGDPLEFALESALGLLFGLLLAYLTKLLLELRANRAGLEALVAERTAEVREREADLNRAQAMAHVGSWSFDLVRNEFRGSAELGRIFGASGSLSYERFLQGVHPEDREAVDGAWHSALKGATYDLEYRIMVAGAIRWVHSHAALMLEDGGKLKGALGTTQDITERKRADQALREGEARYRELFEANPQPMWVYDLETLVFLAVNHAAIAHYGYTRDEFLAMNILDIRPPQEVARLMQRIAQVRQQDVRDAGIWTHRRKDGTLIDVEIVSHTLDFDGRRAQIIHINDVTERLVAERKLIESEQRFRGLTAMSSDFYWESDAKHRLTQLVTGNKEDPALILPGGSPLGKPRWEVPYLTPVEAGWAAHRAGLDAHRPFRDFEYSRLAIDGAARHIAISGDPVFDVSGAFQGYRGVGKDISERKRTEAKIARLTQLYAALGQCNQAIVRCASEDELFARICRDAVQFGGMKSARISLVDPDTQAVRVAASFGYGSEDLQDLEVSMDDNIAHGRGPTGIAIRENRPYWCQEFMNDPASVPWRERGARLGWGSMAALPLYRNGVVIGAFIVFDGEANAFDEARCELLLEMAADISFALENFERENRRRHAERALAESEERFRSLTEMSSDFYWESDTEHRLTTRNSANKKLSTVSAFQRGAQIGERRWDIPHLSPDAAGWKAHRAVLDAHLPFRNFELSRTGVDGGERFISISGDPVFDASGAFKGYRGVGADVTERRQYEVNLRRLNEELERRVAERTQALKMANDELEAFSYSVSHDLRAPLRAIDGFSQLVEKDYAGQLDEQGRDMLRRVRAGAQKMGLLIDDLLKLSRISRQEMRVQRVDLSALVREAADDLRAAEPERNVEWVIAPQVMAEGDPGLLRVVLQNLIGNAWKYTSRRDFARIEFGVIEQDGQTRYFVRDNGAGYDMADAGKLFGAFQRLHSAKEFPGSGIGLATVARILHRHGGEARAEARVNEGATFYFSLG
jgi:PAS domain S-box-containing protein